MGRKMLSGMIGVMTKALTPGSKTGPPAEREYPVEPVWVAIMSPSDWQSRMVSVSLSMRA